MGVFQQDELSKYEFRDLHQGVELQRPEQRLCLAILEDAAMEVIRSRRMLSSAIDASLRARLERSLADVLAWFAAEDWDWPFSFVNVCDAIKANPAVWRKRVREARGPGLRIVRMRAHVKAPREIAACMKVCNGCGEPKDRVADYRRKGTGYAPRCRDCERAYDRSRAPLRAVRAG